MKIWDWLKRRSMPEKPKPEVPKNDLEVVLNWLHEHKILTSTNTNPHKAQRYMPYTLKPIDLENMPKEMIERVIKLATNGEREDPSQVLSEILEGKREVTLGQPAFQINCGTLRYTNEDGGTVELKRHYHTESGLKYQCSTTKRYADQRRIGR